MSSLLTSLMAYWKLDEESGTRSDSHGSNDLSDGNTVLYGTGKVGNAADFELDNDEYLACGDNADLSTGDIDFSWVGWVKLESKPATLMHIAGKGGTNQWEWELEYNNTADRFRFYILDLAGNVKGTVDADNLGAPALATWYLIAVWHDATANKVYIQVNDGTVDEAATTGVAADGTASFTMGWRGDSNYPYDGLIDEAGFWKKVMSAEERTRLYNGGAGMTYPFRLPSASML